MKCPDEGCGLEWDDFNHVPDYDCYLAKILTLEAENTRLKSRKKELEGKEIIARAEAAAVLEEISFLQEAFVKEGNLWDWRGTVELQEHLADIKERHRDSSAWLKAREKELEGMVAGLQDELRRYMGDGLTKSNQPDIIRDTAATAKAHDERVERRGIAKGLREAAVVTGNFSGSRGRECREILCGIFAAKAEQCEGEG